MGRDVPSSSPLILRRLRQARAQTRRHSVGPSCSRTAGSGLFTARPGESSRLPTLKPKHAHTTSGVGCRFFAHSMWESDGSATHTEPRITPTPDRVARCCFPQLPVVYYGGRGRAGARKPDLLAHTAGSKRPLGSRPPPGSGPGVGHPLPAVSFGVLPHRHRNPFLPAMAPTPGRCVIGGAYPPCGWNMV
jgi:hypothetical protein